jgi:RNA polymerase sigma-70 factor (ECF subfamily)
MAGGENDARLVTATRQNRSTFVALYRRYLPRVYRYVYRRVGNQQDAEDLTASVFIEAMESLEDYQEQGSFAGWLFTITHHRVADHHRRQREKVDLRQVVPFLADPALDVESKVEQEEQLVRLAAVIRELAPDRQEALALRFFGELSNKEVAQVMGKSEAAVKMLVCRALRQLRRRCGEDE